MDPIGPQAIQRMLAQLEARSAKAPAASSSADFGGALKSAIDKVAAQQQRADNLQQRFQLGDKTVGIEETMIATQSANLSFQAVLQVRNRLVAAYQDVMNMQV